jgi:hypothetical protein
MLDHFKRRDKKAKEGQAPALGKELSRGLKMVASWTTQAKKIYEASEFGNPFTALYELLEEIPNYMKHSFFMEFQVLSELDGFFRFPKTNWTKAHCM